MSLGFFVGACLVLGILMVICMYNLEFKRENMKGQRNNKLTVRNLNQFKARNLDCKQIKLPSPLESSTLYRGAVSV